MRKIFLAMIGTFFLACTNTSNKGTDADSKENDIPEDTTFDADSAYSYIETQVGFGPRVPGTDGHRRCTKFIIDRLEMAECDTVITQSVTLKNYMGDEIPLTNIMGRFNVENPKRILLLAHYDTRPWADNDPVIENRAKAVPGANDGGSGVGVLLEIARHLADSVPQVGVDMLFVDGEDSGCSDGWGNHDNTWCLGTQHWVKNMPYAPDELPRYGILLDMVGGVNAVFYREYVSERNAQAVNNKVWQVAAASGYGAKFKNETRGGVIDDHTFINSAGIPCIDIIECGNSETGTFFPRWHTIHDDLNGIDLKTLKAVGQTVLNTIYLEK